MPSAPRLKIAGSAKHGIVPPMAETASSPSDPAPQNLPTDLEGLRAFVRELIAERDAAMARCAKLEHLLRVARNAQYGRSSEKLNSDQLELTLEDVEQAVAGIEAQEDKASPAKGRERAAKRRANRGALPPPRSMWTRRRLPCWIREGAGPRLATSGRLPATAGPGGAQSRQASPILTHQAAARCMR